MGKKDKKKKDKFDEEAIEETAAQTETEAEAQAEAEAEADAEAAANEQDGAEQEAATDDAANAQGDDQAGDKQDASCDKLAEISDRLKRTMAEFDNFRKRTEKEKASRFEMGQRSVVERILPVIDNFERGLATLSEDQKKEAFAEGMDKTYKQMLDILAALGVTPIEAVGKEFDPNFHNAVMHEEDPEKPANTITEEFQKGYKMGDSVVRYSMVKVVN